MSQGPLMPKATAVWLVDNTSLTFDQIAEFCHLHPLEVKGIADGEVAAGIKGHDPITSGQLTREEIAKGEADENYRLTLARLGAAGVRVVVYNFMPVIDWVASEHSQTAGARI